MSPSNDQIMLSLIANVTRDRTALTTDPTMEPVKESNFFTTYPNIYKSGQQ